ncbi:phenazine biosynthesis-like protein [Chloropicon primus]|uniref:Phenazine biosynthesis-like protein n=1 Tax=Chloropicon primus TaxID=1764295 RepID=A0A5B8MHA9_9CHLO|nr:phenazine biosynthesis-like protein [Chloropicon primus]|mmetsp:Transcript_8313/g.23787  ORF Transcript_8313/g.23787 Transcript_8313/m.23787 type:complete len:325 (+) Transcript_8313:1-975(+)|eukprot:QDZ19846.1 phenazine biosynthesis-like protein [Chloropicon primus]
MEETCVSRVKQFQVDAFAEGRYEGNPAAVVLLGRREGAKSFWPSDDVLQKIAVENNLSETAFVIEDDKRGDGKTVTGYFLLRWFTPGGEVDLCGHATLASAHVVFSQPGMTAGSVCFKTKSGDLVVERSSGEDSVYRMQFPVVCTTDTIASDVQGLVREAFSCGEDVKVLRGGPDVLLVRETWRQIEQTRPDFGKLDAILRKEGIRGAIVTAPVSPSDPVEGERDALDFVSRFFAPNLGINEDPVTGSAHCCLALYWAKERKLVPEDLGSLAPGHVCAKFSAKQMSPRGGYVKIELVVTPSGKLVTHLVGKVMNFLDGVIDLEE